MNALKNRDMNGELLTYAQAAAKANLGVNTIMKLAKESGSLVRIGRTSRVRWQMFFDYVTSMYAAEE